MSDINNYGADLKSGDTNTNSTAANCKYEFMLCNKCYIDVINQPVVVGIKDWLVIQSLKYYHTSRSTNNVEKLSRQ